MIDNDMGPIANWACTILGTLMVGLFIGGPYGPSTTRGWIVYWVVVLTIGVAGAGYLQLTDGFDYLALPADPW